MAGSGTQRDHVLRRLLRFRLQTLLAAVLVVSLLLSWWIDHGKLSSRIELLKQEIQLLQRQIPRSSGPGWGFAGPPPQNQYASGEEFLDALRNAQQTNDFMLTTGGFTDTPMADEVVPNLIDLLDDPDEDIRSRAIQVLGWIGRCGDQAAPKMISLLDDESWLIRVQAMFALEQFGEAGQTAIPALRAQMMDDDCISAANAAMALNRMDPSVDIGPRLIELLKSRHMETRHQAVQSLSRYVEPSVVKRLLTNMYENEEDSNVRRAIVETLSNIRE